MASIVEDFLNTEEEQDVVEAIRQAELKTSGEIRVHLERQCEGEALERAKLLFHQLKMDNTKAENGVLIYVAIDAKKFAICGDRGINKVVPEGFWQSTKDLMQTEFKNRKFKSGLVKGIISAGEQLAHFFPWDEDDINELSDEISTS
ncbi:TPM domain-containing protein [Leeuwenhoekiella marinoflava]|uniref:TLP18.3/Psb32/MOLO-1 phosphatase superfamily protein n=2 Tax=Leeuwenhoekiella marinoflava TaxID=988 RepID=A0A4V1KS39_9FLAO|nr:TPM domain-containing protein [Leeuwenhoekiella marinoflava]RXG27375.1 TLP18.3/Psb32/MOLO-1 phosphatase superfamily protein [Leeuwenhoekiella marinoflava]SHF70948.1 TLP18.3, Psb32 and MOLO-1 founding protein of phosphatase [Leeuwenhoekiella marinoflava DSM 3653]